MSREGSIDFQSTEDSQIVVYKLAWTIGAKPKLNCEAIELVCGGSPKICVLVEGKALDRVKSEQ